MKKIKNYLKKLTIFDWLVILIILAAAVFFFVFFFTKKEWLAVEVKLSPEQWWPGYVRPPFWLADIIEKGDAQFDVLGRKEAEVLGTEIYEWGGGTKEVFLFLKLRTRYNSRKKAYRFANQTVKIGKPLSLQLGEVACDGIVTYIEGVKATGREVEKVVKAKLTTTPWVAETIPVGEKMRDNRGNPVAEVLEKRVALADMVVVTDRGQVLVRKNPLQRDIYLTLKLVTEEREGFFYFRENQVIKVGNDVWIKLPQVDIQSASITEIVE